MEDLEVLNNVIYTNCFTTWMGEDGIARSSVKKGAVIELRDAKENSLAVNSLASGKYPLLINAQGIKSMSREARKHFQMKGRESKVSAFGVLVNSEVSKIIANFFFSLNPSSVPSRLFTDEKKALEWLRQFV